MAWIGSRRRVAAWSALLLTVSCAPQPGVETASVANDQLPRCTQPKPIANRYYLTFFNHHSDVLTDRAQSSLYDLANYLRRERVYSLSVYGHTDASETGRLDRNLGARRAEQAKRFLIQDGIKAGVITTHSLGATQPLVPTGPGTPEPQNRFTGYRYQTEGTLEAVKDRKDCKDWLVRTFCASPDEHMTQACTTAVQSL